MSNEELQNKIIENVKDKIAIYELEKENRNDKFSMKKFRNVAAVAVLTIGLSIGTAYGANIIYEKIWKEPTKIVGGGQTEEITEESIKENITEDEAREIAKNKLNKIGIEGGELSKTRNYKDSYSEGIEYIFTTDDGKWEITINGMSKEFESLKSCEYNKSYEKYTMTRDEAIEVAKQYYEQLGYKEGEYEFAEIVKLWNSNPDEDKSGYYSARFYKKYGDLYNKCEAIWIDFYAKDHKLSDYSVLNEKYDDNPSKITKEQAIELAIEADKKVEERPIIETKAEQSIKAMNGTAYSRLKDTDAFYKPMTEVDVPNEDIVYYKTEERVRRVWVVGLIYGDTENTGIVNKVARGQFTYYVDATTGEIIGGSTSDEIYWENFHFYENKINR